MTLKPAETSHSTWRTSGPALPETGVNALDGALHEFLAGLFEVLNTVFLTREVSIAMMAYAQAVQQLAILPALQVRL